MGPARAPTVSARVTARAPVVPARAPVVPARGPAVPARARVVPARAPAVPADRVPPGAPAAIGHDDDDNGHDAASKFCRLYVVYEIAYCYY